MVPALLHAAAGGILLMLLLGGGNSAEAAAGGGRQWVGPLANFYNSSVCPSVGRVYGPFAPAAALARCEQLCAATRGCNAMNFGSGFGLPHVGCSLRRCVAPGDFTTPSLHFAGVSGYYCNATDPLRPGSCAGAPPLPPPPPPPASVSLRSIFADSMVLQHGVPARIVGRVTGGSAGLAVEVELDGSVAGRGATAGDGSFAVTIAAQAASSSPHVLTVRASGGGNNKAIAPAAIANVLFGDLYLCSGQSNMELAVKEVDNATAEIAAASWPLIRIAQVGFSSAATPQSNARLTIPWGAVTSKNIGGFSGLCYYFGRRMFQELAANNSARGSGGGGTGGDTNGGGGSGATPIGLVEQAVGGTYIESFMLSEHMAACNTTGRMPHGWKGAPPAVAGNKPYDPWGGANVPQALWNSMLAPLLPLQFKLAIFDQAEQNLSTNESSIYGCLQTQLVAAWRTTWGKDLTFHAVQLPSINMSEYTWIYIDWHTALGEMRLQQAATMQAVPGTTVAVTIDLADLTSPFGSVHNREKQEVGRRLALNVLSTAYERHSVNAGPKLKSVTQSVAANGGQLLTVTVSTTAAGSGSGSGLHVLAAPHFNGSRDCIKCCTESAFETSSDSDGAVWSRVTAPPRLKIAGGGGSGSGEVEIILETAAGAGAGAGNVRAPAAAKWLRYGFDALVQCPFFDADRLPLGPFRRLAVAVTDDDDDDNSGPPNGGRDARMDPIN
jgi:sialate O-acetylesterase